MPAGCSLLGEEPRYGLTNAESRSPSKGRGCGNPHESATEVMKTGRAASPIACTRAVRPVQVSGYASDEPAAQPALSPLSVRSR